MKRKLIFGLICIALVLISPFVIGNYAKAFTVSLSGLTSPTESYRGLDVANQPFSQFFRENYDYTQADVTVTYEIAGNSFKGTLTAVNLKPNFTYQLKLAGNPDIDADSNERIGLAGRWWQENNGTGQNLNNKGDGSFPNPNDDIYFDTWDNPDYRYTGYLVFDYFITDENGDAIVSFEANSSYHVLWATNDSDVYDPSGVEGPDYTGHHDRSSNDGPLEEKTFDADLSAAYEDKVGDNFPSRTVSIFGEWERLPVRGVYLQPGDYVAEIVLTEESFHGSGGTFAGNWAAAMGADIEFSIIQEALVIEAEDASIKTVGGPAGDGWNLWSNGTLGESVSIPEAGTYEVVVRAYGSPLGGIWPNMAITVDDIAGETVTVDSAGYTDHVFQVDLTLGVHTIGVGFLNDAYDPGVEDRNLYLDRLTIISPPGVDTPDISL